MTSAATKRASMPISVDLPTPEAAKTPSRWPRQIGDEYIQHPKAGLQPLRPSAGGGTRPGRHPRSGIACCPAATPLCRRAAARAVHHPPEPCRRRIKLGDSASPTRAPGVSPSPRPSTITVTLSSAKATTSPGRSCAASTITRSPIAAARPNPLTLNEAPRTDSSLPQRVVLGMRAI